MTRRSAALWILSTILLVALPASTQTIHVDLPARTTLDQATSHLEPFRTSAPTTLSLPSVDTTGARFMAVFYTYGHGDPYVYVMVVPGTGGETLYIDKNYDHDLTDDGPPSFFPAADNAFTFDIRAREDSAQTARFLLLRKANMIGTPDSVVAQRVDPSGNLIPSFAERVASILGHPGFEGRFGTFYWDDRMNLRRGRVSVGGTTYDIGLWDCTNDGRFDNDTGAVHDKVLVDVARTGRLSSYDEASVFALTGVIPLGNRRYRVASKDPYGRWLELAPTEDLPPFSFLRAADQAARAAAAPFAAQSRTVDDSLWRLTLRTIDGGSIALASHRGKFLLLNFWGEWCKPCLREIPALVEWSHSYDSSRIRFVSVLETSDLVGARRTMLAHGITWPQVLQTAELEKGFGIAGYPTNILIYPDGRTALRMESSLDRTFLGRILH